MGVMDARRRILLNAPHIATPASAGLVNFSTDMIAPLKECKVHFSPVQSGTGDPSPTNIRPISGWNQAGVHSVRQNLYTGSDISGTQYVETTVSAIPAGTYTFSAVVVTTDTDATSSLVYFYDSGGEIVGFASLLRSKGGARTWTDITLTDVCTKIGFYASDGWSSGEGVTFSYSNIWLDTGANASAVFPSTIYGGYVDLVNGELVQEWEIMDLGTLTWAKGTVTTAPGYCFSAAVNDVKPSTLNAICSAYKNAKTSPNALLDFEFGFPGGNGKGCNIKDSRYTDAATFKAAISGVMLAYELATPIHYPLTPQIIKSLRGANNLWSNANGDTTITYWTH